MNIGNMIPWLGSVGHVLVILCAISAAIAALWFSVLFFRFLGTRR